MQSEQTALASSVQEAVGLCVTWPLLHKRDVLSGTLFVAALTLFSNRVMDKELPITEVVTCMRVLAEVRADLEVFWHLASPLWSCVTAYFVGRKVLSETLPSPAARLLNVRGSRDASFSWHLLMRLQPKQLPGKEPC